ncbi:MAG TPA: M50 family metallopeptidase [Gaiellaceae bacterium]|jgi:regulator of sigma E protease|nr:M50 family metallopeptidase [Gaiellaceae bacterium]
MSLAVSIFGLAGLVLIHELGHFVAAIATGMSPRRFYLGFPPALVKIQRRGVEYGIGAIPLGGYVKIPGMHRPAPSDLETTFGLAVEERPRLGKIVDRLERLVGAGEMDEARRVLPELEEALREENLSPAARRAAERGFRELADGLGDDAYWRQRTWKKVTVIFAGPGANLLVALVLFTGLLMQDAWQIGVRLHAAPDNAATTRIEEVLPGTPARLAGLRAGDRVVAVNGRPVSARGLLDMIAASEGRPIQLTVQRGPATVMTIVAAERRGGLSLPAAVGRSAQITWRVSKEIALFFPRLATGEGASEVSSPVGITKVSSEALDQSFSDFVFVLGLISLSLALLNLLPLLPLDGGHIAFSIIEGIRGRALGRELYERVSVIGIAFVLVLFVIGLSNDVG